jgi:carboxymethylenebutenolidase
LYPRRGRLQVSSRAMTKRIESPSLGELAEPAGSGKASAVVLLQEWWGVNDHIRSLCDRLAKEGFLVFAPDLYNGKTTKTADEAAALATALDTRKAVEQIGGAVRYLREHPRCSGKIGATGFCLGGGLALATACHVPGIAAAVAFYGIPPADKVDYGKVTAHLQGHFAKKDSYVSPDRVEALKKALEAKGKSIELHMYDADHAFVNDTRPEVYSQENAKLAWGRAVGFFKKHLA